MASLSRRKKLHVTNRLAHLLEPGGKSVQDLIVDGYAPAQMIQDLRKYQAELEIQNQALRYSQQEAEGASERFATLFSNVPLALMVVGIIFLFTSSKETTATVAQRSWAREIQIEQMARVSDTAWCDSLPADAYGVSRSRAQRSTRQVADGQTCHDERIDKGDGTFVKRRECTPRGSRR